MPESEVSVMKEVEPWEIRTFFKKKTTGRFFFVGVVWLLEME